MKLTEGTELFKFALEAYTGSRMCLDFFICEKENSVEWVQIRAARQGDKTERWCVEFPVEGK